MNDSEESVEEVIITKRSLVLRILPELGELNTVKRDVYFYDDATVKQNTFKSNIVLTLLRWCIWESIICTMEVLTIIRLTESWSLLAFPLKC